jgi:hypothetical protein
MSGTMKTNAASKTAKETFQVFAQAWVNRAEKLDPKNLVKDILGIKDANGQPFLSAAERNNPLATLLANQVAVPLAEKIFPENLADLATMTGKRKAQAAAPGADQAGKAAAEQKQAAAKEAAPTDSETARQAAVSKIQLEEMQAQLRTLQKTVEQQQKHIDSLQKGRAKKA